MNRTEVEVDAVEIAIRYASGMGTLTDWQVENVARRAIAALDAVRRLQCPDGLHEWKTSGDPATRCVRCGAPWARSPQGEDHEAGIEWAEERALRAIADTSRWNVSTGDRDEDARAAITAMKSEGVVLSRCPSLERDTEKLVEAVQRLVELKDHPNHDSISKSVKDLAWQHVRDALAEFSDIKDRSG